MKIFVCYLIEYIVFSLLTLNIVWEKYKSSAADLWYANPTLI